MTIIEAIKIILNDHPEGLTSKEIYEAIVEKNLYKLGVNVVDTLYMYKADKDYFME